MTTEATIIGGQPRPHYTVPVRAFHVAFGCAAPHNPALMDDQTRYARAQLVTEEAGELFWALAAGDIIKVLDALCDLEYVTCGTIVACGGDRCGHNPPYAESAAPAGAPRLPGADVGLAVGSNILAAASSLCVALSSNRWDRVANVAAQLHVTLGQVWAAFRVSEELRRRLLDEVHRSNMTKFDAQGRPVVNEAGRVVKGPNFEEPRLLEVVRAYMAAHGNPGWSPPPLRGEVSTPLSGGTR